jgi:hypothetical protein
MKAETIEEFLARGGKIRVIKKHDDRNFSPRTKYSYNDLCDNNYSKYILLDYLKNGRKSNSNKNEK